jgi:hypothetical protein
MPFRFFDGGLEMPVGQTYLDGCSSGEFGGTVLQALCFSQ